MRWEYRFLVILLALTSCESSWKGIFGYGEMSSNSVSEIIVDGGTIENAFKGISNYGNGEGYLGQCKIIAENATFRNNYRGVSIVRFNSDPTTEVIQSFKLCDFIVDNQYPTDLDDMDAFVYLHSLGDHEISPTFNGCVFEYNKDNKQIDHFINHTGLSSFGSKFEVGEVENERRSSFKGLSMGIYVLSANTFKVTKSDFDECGFGILSEGYQNTSATITNNVFRLGKIPAEYLEIYSNWNVPINYQFGVHFQGGNSQIIMEENEFTRTQLGNMAYNTIGSHFVDIGLSSLNVIRRNHYTNLLVGNYAEGENGDDFQGLHFLCNKNNNLNPAFLAHDILVDGQQPMRLDQGLYDPLASNFAPARNSFTDFNSSGNSKNLAANSTTKLYKYYVDMDGPSEEIPKYYTQTTIESIPSEADNGCDQKFFMVGAPTGGGGPAADPDTLRERYFEHRAGLELSKYSYQDALNKENEVTAELARKQIVWHKQEMKRAALLGYQLALRDTVSYHLDSVRIWMNRIGGKTGDYMLVEDEIRVGDFTSAQNTLDFMWQKYGSASGKDLVDMEHRSTIYNLILNKTGEQFSDEAIKELTNIAEEEGGQSKYHARAVLASEGVYFPPVFSMPEYIRGMNITDDEDKNIAPRKLKISPNPADYYLRFDWSEFQPLNGSVSIEITDQLGGLIQTLHPAPGDLTYGWTTDKVTGSLCYYRLLIDRQEKDSGQIIINR